MDPASVLPRVFWIATLLAASSAWPTPDQEREAPTEERPEKVEVRLAQLDVSILGAPEEACRLEGSDFDLFVGGRRIEDIIVDRFCGTDGVEPGVRPAATYLLYFDQLQLTVEGRQRSIETARTMIPMLLREGDRALIASGARRGVTLYTGFTSDREELLRALDRLERDAVQHDPGPSRESWQVAELDSGVGVTSEQLRLIRRTLAGLLGAHGKSEVDTAARVELMSGPMTEILTNQLQGIAAAPAAEEAERADVSLRRFRMVLARLAEAEPPRIAIYFGDTLRRNAGEHYRDRVSPAAGGRPLDSRRGGHWGVIERQGSDPDIVTTAGPSSALFAVPLALADTIDPFEDLEQEAATLGIRVYPIEAQGLVAPSARNSQAQATLAALGLDTGGEAFLNGLKTDTMTERLHRDLSCLYRLSFAPEGLPEDRLLTVRLDLKKEGLTARMRGRTVIPSEAAQMESDFLAAAFDNPAHGGDLRLDARMVPLGFDDGAFDVLLQVIARSTLHQEAARSLLFQVSAGGAFFEEVSQPLGEDEASGPVVLETLLRVRPGPFEVIALTKDSGSGESATAYVESKWPDPTSRRVVVLPALLLQPFRGSILRGGRPSGAGAVALGPDQPVAGDLPVALVTLVCGKPRMTTLRVERRIEGDSSVGYPPLSLDLEAGCAQIRDVVPAGTLGSGFFRYTLRALEAGGNEAGRAELRFEVSRGTGP